MPNIKLRKLRKTPLFSPILGPVDIKTVNNFFFTSAGMYDRKKKNILSSHRIHNTTADIISFENVPETFRFNY